MDEGTNAGGSGFNKRRGGGVQEPTLHLYVANCGPAVGLSYSAIEEAFASFGELAAIRAADDSGTRVIISFRKVEDAVAVKEAWSGKPCHLLQGRIMYMQHAVPRACTPIVRDQHCAMITSSELGIPGLILYPHFVSMEEEQELLAAVDPLPWQTLAKRRVQHYGYEFLYKSRNVNLSQKLGNLPMFVLPVVQRISSLPELTEGLDLSLPLDQLTVNEYPRGVGLSPHIDTHSAFEGSIVSLSLAGPCIMEFRRYPSIFDGSGDEVAEGFCASSTPSMSTNQVLNSGIERKALFLPQRSLLVLSDEARYAWHHYIPHHKVDQVAGQTISRGSRRLSFTFRKVRAGPCQCKFAKFCDSQGLEPSGFPLLSNMEKIECSDSKKLVKGISDGFPEGEEEKFLFRQDSHHDNQHQQSHPAGNEDINQRASLALGSGNSSWVSDVSKSTSSALGMPTKQDEILNEISPKKISLCTPEIEKLFVHQVYDAIASHFSATRFAKWPKVALFLQSLAPGSLVADSGCGNGKYLGFNSECFFIGCDISPPLVAICAQRGHEALVADALHLPHRTGFYDAAISIAVLHHLSNEQRRIRAIEELVRVVGAGGKVLITVWAKEQEDEAVVKKWTPLHKKYIEEGLSNQDCKHGQMQDPSTSLERIQEADECGDSNFGNEGGLRTRNSIKDGASRISLKTPANIGEQQGSRQVDGRGNSIEQQQEYFVPWHLPYHRAEVSGASAAAVASGFARRDEKKESVVYDRYYHVFAEGELERLARGVKGADIIDQFYDKSNWCIVLQKS